MRVRKLVASALLVTSASFGGAIAGEKYFMVRNTPVVELGPQINKCATVVMEMSSQDYTYPAACDGLGYVASSSVTINNITKDELESDITATATDSYSTGKTMDTLMGFAGGGLFMFLGLAVEDETRKLHKEKVAGKHIDEIFNDSEFVNMADVKAMEAMPLPASNLEQSS